MATSLTYDTAKSLLCQPPTCAQEEDEFRQWSTTWQFSVFAEDFHNACDQLQDSVLMRTFDSWSGSQPDTKNRMSARASRMRLDTAKSRHDTLAAHIDHKTRHMLTPYISFTNCPQALKELADWRIERKRGDQRIVIVDPKIRFELCLPTLNMKDEMEHYGVKNPYRNDYSQNHYLCLWEVTPEEVVGVYDWSDLCKNSNWFEEVVMPAVEGNRKKRQHLKNKIQSTNPPKSDVAQSAVMDSETSNALPEHAASSVDSVHANTSESGNEEQDAIVDSEVRDRRDADDGTETNKLDDGQEDSDEASLDELTKSYDKIRLHCGCELVVIPGSCKSGRCVH